MKGYTSNNNPMQIKRDYQIYIQGPYTERLSIGSPSSYQTLQSKQGQDIPDQDIYDQSIEIKSQNQSNSNHQQMFIQSNQWIGSVNSPGDNYLKPKPNPKFVELPSKGQHQYMSPQGGTVQPIQPFQSYNENSRKIAQSQLQQYEPIDKRQSNQFFSSPKVMQFQSVCQFLNSQADDSSSPEYINTLKKKHNYPPMQQCDSNMDQAVQTNMKEERQRSSSSRKQKSDPVNKTQQIFNFEPREDQNQVQRLVLLIQTLCQTYNKDRIFASSIIKLLNELKQELSSKAWVTNTDIQSQSYKIEKLEKKKKYYKQMARNQKQEIQDLKKNDENKQKSIKLLYQQLQEKAEEVNFLNRRINDLIHLNQLQGKKTRFPLDKYKEDQDPDQRNSSVESNLDFQDLVKECDRYLFDHSSILEDRNSSDLNMIINDTLKVIKNCDITFDIFQKLFKKDDHFNISKFKQVVLLVQRYAHQIKNLNDSIMIINTQKNYSTSDLSTNPNPFKLDQIEQQYMTNRFDKNKTKDDLKSYGVPLEALNEMKMKILEEITEQLDSKVQEKIQHSINNSDTYSKSIVGHISREDMQKEILHIINEHKSQLSLNDRSTLDSKTLNMRSRNNDFNGGTLDMQGNYSSMAQGQKKMQKHKSALNINKGNERDFSDSSNSILLSDKRPSPSYVVGYDGQAQIISPSKEEEKKVIQNQRKSSLTEKLNQAEKKYIQTELSKNPDGRVTLGHVVEQKGTPNLRIGIEDEVEVQLDDEMLLSDIEFTKQQDRQSMNKLATGSFAQSSNRSKSPEPSAKKSNDIKQPSLVIQKTKSAQPEPIKKKEAPAQTKVKIEDRKRETTPPQKVAERRLNANIQVNKNVSPQHNRFGYKIGSRPTVSKQPTAKK